MRSPKSVNFHCQVIAFFCPYRYQAHGSTDNSLDITQVTHSERMQKPVVVPETICLPQDSSQLFDREVSVITR